MEKKVVTFGEIMMRLAAPGYSRMGKTEKFIRSFAGAESNVAIALSHFEIPTTHVTRLPENELGKAAWKDLRRQGVHTDFVQFGPERMGLYFTETGVIHRSSQVLYDRFDSAFAHVKPQTFSWKTILQQANWFHWSGITPALSEGTSSVCVEALEACLQQQIPVSADINYRSNLWQYGKRAQDVMPKLVEKCDVVVGGVRDFENSLNISCPTFEEACDQVNKKFPKVKCIATTIRNEITSSHHQLYGLLWSEGVLIRSKNYELTPIVDRIGAGDAFMAGLIYGKIQNRSLQDTLDFAMASNALNHTLEGDAHEIGVHEVETLMRGENVGKLLR